MSLVVGIDLSLTGSSVIALDRSTHEIILAPETLKNTLTGMTRLAYLKTKVMSIVYTLKEYNKIEPVFIEGYGFSFRGMDYSLAELGGVIRLSLLEYLDQPHYNIPPSTLKLFITGKGNSAKNVMLEQVYRKYKIGSETLTDDNQVDAYALAQFGIAFLDWEQTKKKSTSKIEKAFEKIRVSESVNHIEAYLSCGQKQ